MNFWFGDSANVIHVSKSGNDANGGVAQQYPVAFAADAKLTIGSAVTACPDGGTIIVWPGDYDETVDIATATKQITLIGTHWRKCRIVPTTGECILGYHGLILKNISCEVQDDASKAVDCEDMDNLSFINCYIHTRGIDAIYAISGGRMVIDNCFVFSSYDAVYGGLETIVRNSTIITDGDYGSGNIARTFVVASYAHTGTFLDCLLMAQAKYGTEKDGKAATVYNSDRDLVVLSIGKMNLDRCIVIADGSLPTLPHVDSVASGDAYCTQSVELIASNTNFFCDTDANEAATVGYGLSISSNTILNNCIINSSGTSAAWDLWASGAQTIRLNNCEYDSSQVHANVTVKETQSYADAAITANAQLTAMQKLQRADKVIDTTQTPWVVDYKEEATENALMSKTMKNTDGDNITSTDNVLGRLIQE